METKFVDVKMSLRVDQIVQWTDGVIFLLRTVKKVHGRRGHWQPMRGTNNNSSGCCCRIRIEWVRCADRRRPRSFFFPGRTILFLFYVFGLRLLEDFSSRLGRCEPAHAVDTGTNVGQLNLFEFCMKMNETLVSRWIFMSRTVQQVDAEQVPPVGLVRKTWKKI